MNPVSRIFFGCFTVCAIGSSALGATFGVSPPSLALAEPTLLTLNVGDLAPGQTVLVERFHDANANGQVDSGELLLLSFQVADGKVAMFGGQRDEAIPGDEDGATNGQLRVELRLSALPEVNRAVGSTLFRVSPLDSSFVPLVQPFAVAQAAQGQSVSGTVTANGSAVPGAMIAALAADGDDHNFVGGVFTDAAGGFALNLATGNYMILALKPGLVTAFSAMPQINLGSGTSITQEIALASASRTISGRVVDAVTSNGIAGLQMFAESSAEEVAVIVTDAAGNFSIGASAGQWKADLAEDGLRLLGYGGHDFTADTTAGDVTGLVIPLSRGRGEFGLVFFFPGGTFGNGTNGVMAFPTQLNYYYALLNLEDVNFPTNVYFSGPSGSGLANTASANFGANYGGDSAYYSSPQINVPAFPPGGVYTVNYKGEPMEYVLADPQAQSRQVLLVPTVTVDSQNRVAAIDWTRRDVNGNSLGMAAFMSSIEIRINGIGGRLYDGEVTPDTTSHMVWDPVTWTNVSSIDMVYNDVDGNQYVSFWWRGTQPLQILTGTNLAPGTVGSPYQALFVAAGGQPSYTWSLQQGSLPSGLNFGGTGEISGNPSVAGTYNLRVRVTDANQASLDAWFSLQISAATANARLEPRMRSPGQFEFRVHGQAGQTYTIEYTTALGSWTPLLTTNAPSDSFNVLDDSATTQARFYRVKQP